MIINKCPDCGASMSKEVDSNGNVFYVCDEFHIHTEEAMIRWMSR